MAEKLTSERNAEQDAESALGRWSRRKATALNVSEPLASGPEFASHVASHLDTANTPAQRETISAVDSIEALPAAEEQEDLEPLLSDADMPDVDSLTSDSNVSCFFNRGVSETLRQAALKRLLHLPAFNIVDGLNDYDEDYTYFEPLGDIITSDMRFHTERKARLAAEEAAASADEAADQSDAELSEAEQLEAEQGESAADQPSAENVIEQQAEGDPSEPGAGDDDLRDDVSADSSSSEAENTVVEKTGAASQEPAT